MKYESIWFYSWACYTNTLPLGTVLHHAKKILCSSCVMFFSSKLHLMNQPSIIIALIKCFLMFRLWVTNNVQCKATSSFGWTGKRTKKTSSESEKKTCLGCMFHGRLREFSIMFCVIFCMLFSNLTVVVVYFFHIISFSRPCANAWRCFVN